MNLLNHEKRSIQEEKEPPSAALHAAVFSDPDPVEPYIYALLDPGDGFIIMNYVSGYLLIFSMTQGKLSKNYQYLKFHILIYTKNF
jgi:hypothetical protein